MSSEVDQIKLLLANLNTTIEVNEEKLKNKVGKAEFLTEMVERDKSIYAAIEKANDRINGLYIKIAGAAGLIVGIIELAARYIPRT